MRPAFQEDLQVRNGNEDLAGCPWFVRRRLGLRGGCAKGEGQGREAST